MKSLAMAAGAFCAALATAASAQYYSENGRWVQRGGAGQECWNPHAGHFEQVRPGERQDDLDFSRCRVIGGRAYDAPVYSAPAYQPPPVYANPNEPGPAYAPGYGWYDNGARNLSSGDECWNPHAGHYEQVRPGERQDDLDFSRCRPIGYGYRYR
jgi:hypothetical protein